MQSQVYSGARVAVKINGRDVAAAFVLSYHISTQAIEVETVDNVFPAEIMPTRIRASLSLRVYRTPDNDPVLDQIVAGLPSIHQKNHQDSFTQGRYIQIDIRDSNDKTIMYFPKAWVTDRQGGVSAGDFLTETWNVIAQNYTGPSS